MRIVSWNAKVGRPNAEFERDLRALIADTTPDVICLQEAGKYTKVLRESFGKHWYVYAKSGWDESTMNPVLVKKKLGRTKQKYGKGWGTLRTKKVWTGPQGGDHTGRTWTWVRVGKRLFMSYHRCTDGNGKNQDAFIEEYNVTTTWLKERTKAALVFGDHNCGPRADHKGSSRNIAEAVKGSCIFDPDESGIDYAISDGVAGSAKRRNKNYGSDHEPVVFVTKK